jgi:putative peptidoglycan lipid II flippase
LFQHGAFSARDVEMTAWALRGMAGGILAFMLIKIFAPGFYARQDTKTPVKIGLISVFANMLLNVVLILTFKMMQWDAVHIALAISSTGSAFVNAGLLYWYLHKQQVYQFGSHWKKIFLQYGIANVVMVAALLWTIQFYNGDVSQWLRIIELLALCALGAVVYGIVLLLTGFRPRHLRHD